MKIFKDILITVCLMTGMLIAIDNLQGKTKFIDEQEKKSSNLEFEFNECLLEYFQLYPMDLELKETFQPGNNFPDAVVRTSEFDKAYEEHLAKAHTYCHNKLIVNHQEKICKQSVVETQGQKIALEATVSKIKLFMYRDCPYCLKVYLFLYSQNLLEHIELIDIELSENKTLLKKISGKTQVPYISDSEAHVKMAESNDIIQYFASKYKITFTAPASIKLSSQVVNTQQVYNPGTFVADMQTMKKPVVILVSTTWCAPCKALKPIFLEIAQQMSHVCEFICLDGDLNISIVPQLGVNCFPSIVCFKHGKQIDAQDYRTQDGLMKLVQDLVKK